MFQLTIYGFIARDDDTIIPKGLSDKVSKGILVGVEYFKKKEEHMHWVKCFFWNNHLSNLYPYLKKGKQVILTGDLSFSAYLNREQQPKVDITLKVLTLTFCKTLNGDIIQKAHSQPQVKTISSPSDMNAVFDSIYGKPSISNQQDIFSYGNDVPDLEIPF